MKGVVGGAAAAAAAAVPVLEVAKESVKVPLLLLVVGRTKHEARAGRRSKVVVVISSIFLLCVCL